jgi:septum formation protein
MDKAGAYGAQAIGSLFLERFSGSYTNVVGLPLGESVALLEQAYGMDRSKFRSDR